MESGAEVIIYKTEKGAWSMQVVQEPYNWELVANLLNDLEHERGKRTEQYDTNFWESGRSNHLKDRDHHG